MTSILDYYPEIFMKFLGLNFQNNGHDWVPGKSKTLQFR